MEQRNLYGFICTQEEQAFFKFITPIGLLVMYIFSGLFLRSAFVQNPSPNLWIFSVSFLAFTVFLTINHFSMRYMHHLQYAMSAKCAVNSYKQHRIVVDFCKPVFISKVSLEFHYGKAKIMREFFIIANAPLNSDCIGGYGLLAIKRFLKNEIVSIPCTEETTQWLMQKLQITAIAQYPKISYKPV